MSLFHFVLISTYPNVSISATPNNINLTTGQLLTLECTIVAVLGISSTLDIVWYVDGLTAEVRRVDNITAMSIINNTAAVYRDSYVISSLTTQHNGRLYSCQAVINDEPLLITSSSIRLHVACKFTREKYYITILVIV